MITGTHNLKTIALNLLRAPQPDNYVAGVRSILPTEFYGLLADELIKIPVLKNKIPVFRRSADYRDLQSFRHLEPISPEKEIRWMKAFLQRSISQLENYFSLSEAYSNSLLFGDYKEASDCLTKIELEYGCSIWLLKTKINFLQLTEGLESQKKFANLVKQEVAHKGMVAYLTYWISLRNEESITKHRFQQLFIQNTKRWTPNTKQEMLSYMRYHLLGEENLTTEEAVNLVRVDFSRSLIDLYESFLSLCRIAAVSESPLKKNLFYFLNSLKEKCSDKRLSFISSMYNCPDINIVSDIQGHEAYDFFIKGNHEEALTSSLMSLKKSPTNPYNLFIFSFAKSLLGDESGDHIVWRNTNDVGFETSPLIETITDALSKCIRDGSGATSDVSKLEKLTMNLGHLDWAGVFNIGLNFTDPEKYEKLDTLLSLLKNSNLHPLLLNYARNELVFDNCVSTCLKQDESPGLKYSLIICDEIDESLEALGVFTEEINLFEGRKYFDDCNFERAIEKGNELVISKFSYYQRNGHKLIVNSLIKLKKIEDACKYVSKLYVVSPFLASIFPLEELSKILLPSSEKWRLTKHSISLSIVMDAIVKNVSSDFESFRAYACEDFLSSNNFEKPSEVPFDGSPEMIYYFKNLCIESIMDVSTVYENSLDVENERLAVLRKLMDINPSESEVYSIEIKGIIRTQLIRSKIQEIEQNKVYIDIAKLKQWAFSELEESYNRYLVYLSHGIDAITTAAQEEALSKADSDVEAFLSMKVPVNESFALFSSLIKELREGYALSPLFGLNRYLSTRLRHGAIENQLRKPVQNYLLITKKEGKKGVYKPNFHWMARVGKETYTARNFDSYFNRFSEHYDKLISEISLEWVQVNEGNDPKALFMPPIKDGEIALFQKKINVKTTFSQFLDIIFKYFDIRLGASLEIARSMLNNEGKARAKKIINLLQSQVSRDGVIGELDTAINQARTEVQLAFDKVIEWFSPAQSIDNTPFTLDDAITFAEAIVKDTTPNFSISVKYVDSTSITMDLGLATVVDIFVDAFENVVKRSGLEIPVATVNVSLNNDVDNSNLTIKITNQLGPTVDEEDLIKCLELKKETFKSGDFNDLIAKEHGSGFFKIYQGLEDIKDDMKRSSEIDFGVDEHEFFLVLSFPFSVHDAKPEEEGVTI